MANISNFKKGDNIVRLKPAIGSVLDYSFIGKKMKFLGIANGQIYVKHPLYTENISLSVDVWGEHWELFVDIE